MAETVDVTLPAMGESVAEGIVARWVKKVGDEVKEGETVVEVTTDKVDVEVPAPAAGTVAEIAAQEGDTVQVGATLARITPGASASAKAPDSTADASAPAEPPAPEPPAPLAADRAASRPEEPPAPPAAEAPSQPESSNGVPASPLARRAAVLRGADPSRIEGTGPGGLVRRMDVDAPPAREQPRSAATPQARSAPTTEGGEPLRGPAAALVDYMEQSRDIPTATSFRTVSVTRMDAMRRELNTSLSAAGRAGKVSFTHLIGYAIARAAAEMPQMTAHFARTGEGKPARVPGAVNLGLAVDSRLKDGTRFLVVPVIRDAAERSFAEFRDEYERLIERTRNNTLGADELQGATITLTNPGGIGTVASVPRLMPGQGAIIAVGAIGRPAEWQGADEARLRELGVGKVMTMTSTYDHRIIQGAQSGEFLARVEALLAGADGFYDDVFKSLELRAPAAGSAAVTAPQAAGTLTGTESADRALLAAMQAATSLVKAHRTHGHLGAHLDPLGSEPVGDPAMEPATYGLTPELMRALPANLLRVYVPGETLAEVLPELRRTYCGTIAYEIEHIASHEQRLWLREHIESGAYRLPPSKEERLRLLGRLTKVDAMERYLRRTFLGQKTFSIEGLDAMVPMLEALLTQIAGDGVSEVVMGMPHRGRLAVIAHVVNRPYESILNTFEIGEARRAVGIRDDDPTGDVKYHLGATGTYVTETGKAITVRLLSNPSHLEAVDPVVEGCCRAEQTQRHAAEMHLDPMAALPVLIHGDAAFSGQGVVAEVFNLQSLDGYTTGGTVHVIADNQVGFTTDPREARSTRYASDLAKGFDVPIVHVNADDIEACISAVLFAYDYRRTYHRDVVIHLIGYRRFGHNETDEPAYTQPLLYSRIRSHPTVREVFAQRLIDDGVCTKEEIDKQAEEAYARVGAAHKRVKENLATELDEHTNGREVTEHTNTEIVTGVRRETLLALNDELLLVPEGFTVNSKLARQLERRRTSLQEGAIDWGTAEALAFGSLLLESHPVRLTGQDTVRGTFSQRHLAFHDERTGDVWIPMQHLNGAVATFEVHNSPLSEVACLGFEYGYSAADPDTLVIWEAQYGDFVNNAQMVVDQFVSAGRAKWGQRSRLTLLLPHGYEGSGPEHSSARLERFLSLGADANIRVANCSTSAQYFHLLRNQGLLMDPRPLVVMTPKSLLRLRDSMSNIGELSGGRFSAVLDDADAAQHADDITSIVFCSGRLYYDLMLHELRKQASDLAIVRVELLHPVPVDGIVQAIERYRNARTIVWAQEEPENMGAWNHIAHSLRTHDVRAREWEYVGRPPRASPSEGYAGSHRLEQERIVLEALRRSSRVRESQASAAGSAHS